jgi:hypothetical protein
MVSIEKKLDYFPIDWMKAEVIGIPKEIFTENSLLNWKTLVKKGGEIDFEQGEFNNLLIQIYPDPKKTSGIFFSGSLHKFSNGGSHNYNDFTCEAFARSLNALYKMFGVKPENLRLLQLEFGVNIIPPIETTRVLDHLFQFKTIDFANLIHDKRGYYKQIILDKYILKIYDKGIQNKLLYNLLRIEVKQTNWSEYRKLGIETLADFIKHDKRIFLEKLVDYFASCVFYDPTNVDANRWDKFRNAIYWSELRDSGNRVNFCRDFKRLKKINSEHGQNVQQTICDLIKSKVEELQSATNSDFSDEPRFCLVTGEEITMQRKDSFLLSHSGIQHLIKTDYKRFERLKTDFLQDRYATAKISIQVKELAHTIRNRHAMLKKKAKVQRIPTLSIVRDRCIIYL